MKLDFNLENNKKNKIELMNCQVDLVLRSLEFYCYTYQFVYPRAGKSASDEENLRICFVRDTYHQILNQYDNNFKCSQTEFFKNFHNNFKKSA